jgi:hypothetical protein
MAEQFAIDLLAKVTGYDEMDRGLANEPPGGPTVAQESVAQTVTNYREMESALICALSMHDFMEMWSTWLQHSEYSE